MPFTKRLILILFVLVACVGCDQATKTIATTVLPETAPWSFLYDTVRLQLTYNQGAFLSFGDTMPLAWRQAAFIGGAGCLLAVVLGDALFLKPSGPVLVLAAALICGGGMGNLWDRVVRDGRVVDFINVGLGPVRTGIFNLADILIMLGGLLFIVHAWQRPSTPP